jgi:glutamate N-acetyltransferase/amino-acid N-acetyltransferase
VLQFDVWLSGNIGANLKVDMMKSVSGGFCAAKGFRSGALRAGIKRVKSEKLDLAVLVSDVPCVAAGVFTTNRVKAAPVLVSQKHLRTAAHCGVVLNSGNANACTGAQGMEDAHAMAEQAAATFGGSAPRFLVCSTGRIGVPMPMSKVLDGISSLGGKLTRRGSRDAAIAIMTSDTFPKEVAMRFSIGGKEVHIGGIAKGAGMINPNMATMFCVLTTDGNLPKNLAQKLLAAAVEKTFNRITVDGDMSTNDTVLLLANGESGAGISASDKAGLAVFQEALETVCVRLAKMIVRDGEGTTKIVEIDLRGARNAAQARRAAEAVANSVLLKCAWAGADPNWGRIMDALGYSGAVFDPQKVDIFYDSEHLVRNGEPGPAKEQKVKKIAAKPEFTIRIELAVGTASHKIWSSDLTEEYVRLNLSE